VPVEFDGSNYPAWKESIGRVFTLRRAKWFLDAREPDDDELNVIALSVLTASLSVEFRYLLEGQTSFPDAYKLICDHAESQISSMQAGVDVLRRELVNLKQGTDSSSVTTFLHKVTTKDTAFLRDGGTHSVSDLINLIVFGLNSHFVPVKQQHLISPFKNVASLR
jgi:hypothetical protein